MVADVGDDGQESKILEKILSRHISKNSLPPCTAGEIIEEFSAPLHTRGQKLFCCAKRLKWDLRYVDGINNETKKEARTENTTKEKETSLPKKGTGTEKEITRTDIEMAKKK